MPRQFPFICMQPLTSNGQSQPHRAIDAKCVLKKAEAMYVYSHISFTPRCTGLTKWSEIR